MKSRTGRSTLPTASLRAASTPSGKPTKRIRACAARTSDSVWTNGCHRPTLCTRARPARAKRPTRHPASPVASAANARITPGAGTNCSTVSMAPIAASTPAAKPSKSGASESRTASTALETHSRIGTRNSSTAGPQARPHVDGPQRRPAADLRAGGLPRRPRQGRQDRALDHDPAQPAARVDDRDGARALRGDRDHLVERGVDAHGRGGLHQVAVDALGADASLAEGGDDPLRGHVAADTPLAVDDEDARQAGATHAVQRRLGPVAEAC